MTAAIRAHLPSVDGVVFDYGGVIALSPRGAWRAETFCLERGLGRGAFDRGFADYRSRLDSGRITAAEMYRRIFADNSLPPLSDSELEELVRLDHSGWNERFSEATYAFMREVKALGKKVGILTNMSPEFFDGYFRRLASRYRELADAETISGFEGVVKPDPRIYAIMSERLGIAPGRLLFIDDTEPNLAGARACGWRAERYLESL